jgi:bifunctional DNase/RNase
LAATVLVGLVGLGATGVPERTAPLRGQHEAEVVAVVLDPQSRQPLVVLQSKRDRRHLALAIGQFEANGIALPLQGVTPPRPLTHDLMLTLLGDLRASVRRIVITDLKDDVYYARLEVDVQGGSALAIDARPSDAIALALRAKAPILVEERVFDRAERLAPKPGASPHF